METLITNIERVIPSLVGSGIIATGIVLSIVIHIRAWRPRGA